METQPKKEINYWFVDAGYKSFEDRKRLSLADKKIWLCNNDYYGHLVKTMQPGDKIALKSHFFRKYDLPFNNKGQDVPIMSIEAIGVIVKNFNDGKKVSVVWNKYESPREWYFYTSQALVFCIQKGLWMSDNLLAFTFEQHNQDLHRFLLTPYWHDRFNDTQPYFFWSRIGESLAKRLIEFRHKRDKFIPLLHLLFKQIDNSGLLLTHQQLVSAHDMDPFAILELCFRALINKKISGNIDELATFFAIDPFCLNVIQSIPFIDPDKQCHFSWTLEPDELRINILWQLLDAALHYTDNQDLQARSTFIDILEKARQFYSLANITLALSWIKPWAFLSLNEEVIKRLPEDIAEFIQSNGLHYSQDVRHYLELIETLDYLFLCGKFSINSFPALTQYVYQSQITKPIDSLKVKAQKPTFNANSNGDTFTNQESIEKHDLSYSDNTDITLDFHLTKLSNTESLNGIKEPTAFIKHINEITEKEAKPVLNQPTMLDETANIDTIQTETISPLIFDSDIYQSMAFEFDIDSNDGQLEEVKSISFDSVIHYPTMLDYEMDTQAEVIHTEKIKPLLDDSEIHHPSMLDYEIETDASVTQSGGIKPLLDNLEEYYPTMLEYGIDADINKTMRVTPLASNTYDPTILENDVIIETNSLQSEIHPTLSYDLDYIKPTLQAEEIDITLPEVLSSLPFELYGTEPARKAKETETDFLRTGVISPLPTELNRIEPIQQAKETEADILLTGIISPLSSESVEAEPPLQAEGSQIDVIPSGGLSPLSVVLDDGKPQQQGEETEADILLTGIISPLSSESVEAEPPLQAEGSQIDVIPSGGLSPLSVVLDDGKPQQQGEETEADILLTGIISPLSSESVEAEPPLQAEGSQIDVIPSGGLLPLSVVLDDGKPQQQGEETEADILLTGIISPLSSESVEAEPPLQAEEIKVANISPEVVSPSPLKLDAIKPPLQAEEIKVANISPEVVSPSPLELDAVKPPLQAEEIKVANISPEVISSSPLKLDAVKPPLQAEEIKVANISPEVIPPSPLELDAVKPPLQAEEIKVADVSPEILPLLLINLENNKFIQHSKEIEADILKVDARLSLPSNSNDYSSVVPINEVKFNTLGDNETTLVENTSMVNNIQEQDYNQTIIKENDQHLSKRRTKASGIINSVKQALAALSIYHTDEQSTKTHKIDNDFNQLLINEKFINNGLAVEELLDNSQKIAVETANNDTSSSIRNDVSYDKAAVLDLLANYKEKEVIEAPLPHHDVAEAIIGSNIHAIEADLSLSQTIIDEKTAIKEPQIDTSLDGSENKSDTSKAINFNSTSSAYSLSYPILNDCFFDEPLLQDVIICLKDKHNLVLQGPGGTGKSWLARRLAIMLTESENSHNIYTLQSHSNLSYERFIGQLYIDNQGNQKIKEGIFLSLIKSARRQPEMAHVMIIEDIHRINPTEIFGDLFFLLDINQRTDNNTIVFYPSENGKENSRFFIPNNVYIIATMNIIPSCLYSMGYEWRRPFAFVSLEPQINERWRNWLITHCNVNSSLVVDIQQRLLELNQMIAADSHLGRHCCIGHSYVTPNKPLETNDTRGWFKRIVEMEIAPLLDLYWSDRPEYALQAKKRLLEGW